jgi:hypothetical protein
MWTTLSLCSHMGKVSNEIYCLVTDLKLIMYKILLCSFITENSGRPMISPTTSESNRKLKSTPSSSQILQKLPNSSTEIWIMKRAISRRYHSTSVGRNYIATSCADHMHPIPRPTIRTITKQNICANHDYDHYLINGIKMKINTKYINLCFNELFRNS